MVRKSVFSVLFVILLAAFCLAQNRGVNATPTITVQSSGTTNSLIAVNAVNSQIVWAAGRFGTFTMTADGGKTWHAGVVPGAEGLQFRDVEAVSAKVAYLMSISPTGIPAEFRVYKTVDGGATWTLQFQNEDPAAFYDCMSFWTPNKGLVFSDSNGTVFPVIRTFDGTTWQNIGANMPAPLPGEASFAASGTCLATQGGQRAWVGTAGDIPVARVLTTSDGGNTWNAFDTPFAQTSEASGIASIGFRTAKDGFIAGGDLVNGIPQFARSTDGGQTWTMTNAPSFAGAIYGAAYVQGRSSGGSSAVVATSPAGSAWSPDEGTSWYELPELRGLWGIDFATPQAGWLVGTGGQIVKVSF